MYIHIYISEYELQPLQHDGNNMYCTYQNAFIYLLSLAAVINNPFFVVSLSLHRLFICSVNGAGKHIFTLVNKVGCTYIHTTKEAISGWRHSIAKIKIILEFYKFTIWKQVYIYL